MKTIRRNISYNVACSILEANHFGVTGVQSINHKWTVLYKNDQPVARYHEPTGRLQVPEAYWKIVSKGAER